MVKTLLLIYILSTFVVIGFRHFAKNGHEFNLYAEVDWVVYLLPDIQYDIRIDSYPRIVQIPFYLLCI
jgi:hypothetical protein